jgi:hypothetical protein
MSTITVLHVQGHDPSEVERALDDIFAGEERARMLRIEGTFSAVAGRALDPKLDVSYRYLICRPHPDTRWTPLLELGNRTVGLDVELSRRLQGCAVFTTFVYGDTLSGYRLARDGAEVDRYASDPVYLVGGGEGIEGAGDDALVVEGNIEAERGHPERFADLLPAGTSPEDFTQVVLRPGWWEAHDTGAAQAMAPADEDDEEIVDETDRMRCIALALELWGPTEYPFSQEFEDIPNKLVGPAIALAFA